MLQLLMAVLMFVGAYVTHTGKFTMFYSYYNPRMDQSKIDEIEAKRKKKATVLLLVMGVLSILSAVLSFASVVFFAELCLALYMFVLVYMLGTLLGGEGNQTIFLILSVVIAFFYFSTSFNQRFHYNYFNFETEGSMIIAGSFETEIKLDDIDSLTLMDKRPDVGTRVGTVYEFNGTFHGRYTLADGKEANLYYNGESQKCIAISANGEMYYLSMKTDADNESAIEMIKDVKANGWAAVKDKYLPAETEE